jgi:transposase-like protein
MVAMRWPNGVCCPACGSIAVKLISTRWVRVCNDCKKQFSTKVGSIFEDSALPLSKWLTAIWLLAGAKNGISSCELARALGITQKSAWFVLHRIREAMTTGTFEKFKGTVEADESYIGGLEKNKHANKRVGKTQGRSSAGKTVVMGVLERSDGIKPSKVTASIIPTAPRPNLHGEIRRSVQEFATVYTDAWRGYNGLSDKYIHDFIDHTVMYAIGQVHTNGIENFWSLLKRILKGTYVSVEPFHLKRYIDEMVFRFNNRAGTDRDRFVSVLSMVTGKRLTYADLTASYQAYYQQVLP